MNEPFATLQAQPVAAVGVSDAVLIIGLEQFPTADEAMIFPPSIWNQSEIVRVFSEAHLE